MNIFGKEAGDYAHLAKLESAGKLDAHMAGLKQRGFKMDFQSGPTFKDVSLMDANELTAQSLGVITNNMMHIQAEIDHIRYTEFRLPEFFDLDTSIPEGATSYAYKVLDRTGKGSFITGRGTDAGSASVSMGLVPYGLEEGGITADWSHAEMRNAQFGGVALDSETVQAATTGALDHIEEVGLVGSAAQGFEGLINSSVVPTDTTASTIAAKTADDLVTFLQAEISALVVSTKEVIGKNFKKGMTVYLPTAQYADVSQRKLATDASKSVWEYVSVNNVFTQMTGNKVDLRSVLELAGAGGASADRMMVGVRDKKVVEMGAPIMPRALSGVVVPFGMVVPVEYKISGLNFKRPTMFSYTDGV